jgi:hypothetical protein
MKMLAEYLDMAMKFEAMAAQENDPTLKADFEKQAAAYRSSLKNEPRNTASNARPTKRPDTNRAAPTGAYCRYWNWLHR